MKLSIVTTLYKSAAFIREFHSRMSATAQKITGDYEIIYVNDGSPDDSIRHAMELFSADKHVKVVDLSRNFGHHKAAMTGLMHATGEYVFMIDVDLEEKPELLTDFWEEMNKSDADVIYGISAERTGNPFKRLSGSVYWWIYRKFSAIEVPTNLLMVRLMKRKYVEHLVMHREHEIDITGLWAITGYDQRAIAVERYRREGSTYTLSNMVQLFLRSMTGFSNLPLKLIGLGGLIIFVLAFFASLAAFVWWLIQGSVPGSNTAILLSIWLVGGMIITAIGVVAIYVSVIVTETKGRPYTIVKNLYEHSSGKEK